MANSPNDLRRVSPAKLAGYGLNPAAIAAALHAQNAVDPSGVITTDKESIKLRVSGAMVSEKDILAMNFVVGERIVRLADIAEVRREYADPPDPIFRITASLGWGCRFPCATEATYSRSAKHRADHEGAESRTADRH